MVLRVDESTPGCYIAGLIQVPISHCAASHVSHKCLIASFEMTREEMVTSEQLMPLTGSLNTITCILATLCFSTPVWISNGLRALVCRTSFVILNG